ncbi:sugar ABC transporter ATP-binding protein [Actinopolyspora halophila]|uniref:sugar ABC transporter ATP-binding protein n=1 Tax=Actinopolyspora halophila TaxID=1850 RepID=UPI00036C248E|nr:sugar ABC transporter ATP-binding protein [Actinopolyspora halophila]
MGEFAQVEGAGNEPLARLTEVSKRFPGVDAVTEVSLDVFGGEVHVFAGENGAGKSTLMKLLAQVDRPTSGRVEIAGSPVTHRGPAEARRLGVAMVHQEFALAPDLTVAENLFIGQEPGGFGWILRGRERALARGLLRRVGLSVRETRPVRTLSTAEQQRVEIAKALAVDARLLILDEPTASLTERESRELFTVLGELTAQGMAVCYISHRLDEIFAIGDRVTVLRDGAVVTTAPVGRMDEPGLVRSMVGREVDNLYPRTFHEPGPVRLEVRGLERPGALHHAGLAVRAGEIVGLAGLVGAGRTELARAVFGAEPATAGSIRLDGRPVRIRRPRDAIAAGIGYLTESRKTDGLALQLGVDVNITLGRLPMRGGLIDLRGQRGLAEYYRESLGIRVPRVDRPVRLLSGGNQQKVVLARILRTGAEVLLFDEPGRGMDVAAKSEMFQQLDELAAEGRAIVLISSYLPELMNMCDRILVLRAGRVVGELEREEYSEQRIVALATGAGGEHEQRD